MAGTLIGRRRVQEMDDQRGSNDKISFQRFVGKRIQLGVFQGSSSRREFGKWELRRNIFPKMRRLKEAAVESAFKAVRELEERLGPVSAAVVGSYARGDFNQWSDLDVLVVSPNFVGNPLERFEQFVEVSKKVSMHRNNIFDAFGVSPSATA
ncbi:MAG: nucleotidyltransferase domain-containing protein [Candidatus Caldarchaeum sp.]|nr:nucleotidyltransferase domain-containing protein [Candidatus Caldarchaeum sp.]